MSVRARAVRRPAQAAVPVAAAAHAVHIRAELVIDLVSPSPQTPSEVDLRDVRKKNFGINC
jgi:hypothetical protein